jgi:hypothetical protein
MWNEILPGMECFIALNLWITGIPAGIFNAVRIGTVNWTKSR